MLEKNAVTAAPIHELLARRWSPRAYDKSKAVSRAQILSLIEAARWAPSCNGDEPWRYLVWNRADDETGWQQAFDLLSDGNKKWCANVPVLMLSNAGSVFGHNGKQYVAITAAGGLGITDPNPSNNEQIYVYSVR